MSVMASTVQPDTDIVAGGTQKNGVMNAVTVKNQLASFKVRVSAINVAQRRTSTAGTVTLHYPGKFSGMVFITLCQLR